MRMVRHLLVEPQFVGVIPPLIHFFIFSLFSLFFVFSFFHFFHFFFFSIFSFVIFFIFSFFIFSFFLFLFVFFFSGVLKICFFMASSASRFLETLLTKKKKLSCLGGTPLRPLFFFLLFVSFSCSFSCSFFSSSDLHRRLSSSSWWLPVGCQLVTICFSVTIKLSESRIWWVAGGSSHTFVAESPDECARAVMGVTPQSSLFSLLSSLSAVAAAATALNALLKWRPRNCCTDLTDLTDLTATALHKLSAPWN